MWYLMHLLNTMSFSNDMIYQGKIQNKLFDVLATYFVFEGILSRQTVESSVANEGQINMRTFQKRDKYREYFILNKRALLKYIALIYVFIS